MWPHSQVVKDEVEARTQGEKKKKTLQLAGEGRGAGGNLRFLNWYSRLMSFTWVKSGVSYYNPNIFKFSCKYTQEVQNSQIQKGSNRENSSLSGSPCPFLEVTTTVRSLRTVLEKIACFC